MHSLSSEDPRTGARLTLGHFDCGRLIQNCSIDIEKLKLLDPTREVHYTRINFLWGPKFPWL
jgi:hypothetical protein